jgi:hypothetical protein
VKSYSALFWSQTPPHDPEITVQLVTVAEITGPMASLLCLLFSHLEHNEYHLFAHQGSPFLGELEAGTYMNIYVVNAQN